MICAGSKDCKENGVWQPIICAWAKGFSRESHKPLKFYFDIAVCESCRLKMDNLQNFLTPEGRKRIKEAIEVIGKAEPDLDGAVLEWDLVPPDSKDLLKHVMIEHGKKRTEH